MLVQIGTRLIAAALLLALCALAGHGWMWIYEAHLAGVLPAGLVAAGMGIYLATSLFIVPSRRRGGCGATGGASRRSPQPRGTRRRLSVLQPRRAAGAPSPTSKAPAAATAEASRPLQLPRKMEMIPSEGTSPVPLVERPAEPGEVCTCGRPAVIVFTGGPYGDTGYCGVPDGGLRGPCRWCGGQHDGRCPQYRVRPTTDDAPVGGDSR